MHPAQWWVNAKMYIFNNLTHHINVNIAYHDFLHLNTHPAVL